MTPPTAGSGGGLPVEIGPATRRDPVLPVLVAVLAAGLLWLALDLLVLTGGRELVVVAVPAVPGLLILWLAVALWRAAPLWRGTLVLDAQTVALQVAGPLRRGAAPVRLRWDEIAAIRHRSFRATQAEVGFELTHEGALAQGRVRPSTRRSPRMLVRQTIWANARAFDRPPDAVVAAILGAAEAAGRSVRYRGGEYIVATNRRWDLSATPGTDTPQG